MFSKKQGSGITKGQHYLPRYYLRRFSFKSHKQHVIWVYYKKNHKIFKTNITEICKENWFYDRTNEFERILADLDYNHSKFYNIIKKNPIYSLTKSEKRIISEFVYLIHTRTRKARENTLKVNKMVQHNKEFRKEHQKEFPGHNVEEDIENLRKTFQLSNIFGIELPSFDYNPGSEEIIDKMMNYDYYLLKNITSMNFYTNDHPIIRFTVSDKIGVKVALPIRSNLYLIMSNDEKWMEQYPLQTISVNQNCIQMLNEAIVKIANKFIFSQTKNFSIVEKVLAKSALD